MLNKKAKVSFIFILVCIASLVVWFYFDDAKTALIIFMGYAGIRILMNFLKRDKVYYEDY